MDGGDGTSQRPGSAVLGPALALPALAIVVLGANAERPPWSGDGAWTTPLQVLLAVAGLGLLVALVMVLQSVPGDMPRSERGSSRSRWWVLAGALAVGVLAWLTGVAAREPDAQDAGGGDVGFVPGLSGEGVEPLATTTTAVVAGVVALGLLVALVALVLRSRIAGSAGAHVTAAPDGRTSPPTGPDAGRLPDGPPRDVVLAGWAIARRTIVARLDAGEHDPAHALLRRVAGTPVAAPLRTLTDLYLPVRYGRAEATDDDAADARRALAELRDGIAGLGAGR